MILSASITNQIQQGRRGKICCCTVVHGSRNCGCWTLDFFFFFSGGDILYKSLLKSTWNGDISNEYSRFIDRLE